MTHTLTEPLIFQSLAGTLQVFDLNELFHPQLSGGLFAISTALSVLSVRQGVRSPRINNEQRKPLRFQIEGDVFDAHIAAIQCKGMAFFATQRRGLVQSPGVCSRNLVFCTARTLDEDCSPLIVWRTQRTGQTQVFGLVNGDGHCAFKGSRGRKPTTAGNAGVERSVKAANRPITGLLKRPRNAGKIRGPANNFALAATRCDLVEVQFIDGLAGLGRNQAQQAILAWGVCDESSMREGNGKTGTPVVVDVLANNIDAPGCRPYVERLVAESFFKKFAGEFASFLGAQSG